MKGEGEAMKFVGKTLGIRDVDKWTVDERMTFARMAQSRSNKATVVPVVPWSMDSSRSVISSLTPARRRPP